MNPEAISDGYKVDHRRQYPKGTTLVNSNFTPRSVAYTLTIPSADKKVVVFGLQYFIKWYLIDSWNKEFFSKPKEEVIKRYKRRIDNYLGEGAITFEHIEALHDLQYLPLKIEALPEGSVVDVQVPVLTVENTVPEFFWLPNFFETIMSCMLWKASTSATTARKYRMLLDKWCAATGGNIGFVPFQGHDFSFRGMAGLQDAQMSGAGHLLSFVGTDTIPAIDFLEDYYVADVEKELVGCSVPATEHSVMCMGGKESEIDTFRRLITEVYPTGIVSIVSDTWDFWKVVTEFLPTLKETIEARDGKVVIRPDSGDPADILCGTSPLGGDTPEEKGLILCLWETFGGTTNAKEFKELAPCIGAIYGDSITLARADDICARLAHKGFTSTNVVFGIGSYTYEYVTRDTSGWAMKATAGIIDGKEVEVFKDPKTDSGLKKSAKGFLVVRKDAEGEYKLIDQQVRNAQTDMEPVFVDGTLMKEESLAVVRKRLQATY